MSKKNCDLVKDLLPLYADGICSEESRKTVAEHIAVCDSCRSELTKMQTEINISEKADEDISIIKRIKRKIIIEKIIIAVASVVVLAAILVPFAFNVSNDYSPLNYEKNNLAENVYIEEDESGKLWLVRTGLAEESVLDFGFRAAGTEGRNCVWLRSDKTPEVSLNDAEEVEIVVSLGERNIIHYLNNLGVLLKTDVKSEHFKTTRTMMYDPNRTQNSDSPKKTITGIHYYDTETGNDYVLWERK